MEKIKSKFIIEIMGRPPEHIKETLNTIVVKLGSEKGISLVDKKYNSPKAVPDVKNLYTAFAELDIEFDSFEAFFNTVLGYMPSHIEIYEPEKIKISVDQMTSLSNFLVSKLHRFDEIVKRALSERDILLKQVEYLKSGGKPEILNDNQKPSTDKGKKSKRKSDRKQSAKKKSSGKKKK